MESGKEGEFLVTGEHRQNHRRATWRAPGDRRRRRGTESKRKTLRRTAQNPKENTRRALRRPLRRTLRRTLRTLRRPLITPRRTHGEH